MALRYRTITGTFVNPETGDPANGGIVRFQLKASDFDVSESSIIDQKEYEYTLDSNGDLPTVTLWCTGDGDGNSFYRCYTPSGDCFDFTLSYDASSIDIATLRQQGAQTTTPSVIGYLNSRLVKNLADYDDLPTAVSSIGATECRLRIASAVSLTANLTIPDNITIEIIDDGEISVASSYTCTIHSFAGATRKVFAGAGSVILEKNAVQGDIDFTWWAGLTNAGDIYSELNDALASAGANAGGVLRIPSGTWKTSGGRFDRSTSTYTNGHRINNTVTIRGDGKDHDAGRGAVIELTDTDADAFALANYGAADDGLIRNITIEDLSIKCPSGTGVGLLIHGQAPDSGFGVVVNRVAFNGGERGIMIKDHHDGLDWEILQVHVKDCAFTGCTEAIYGNCVNSSLAVETCNISIPLNGGGINLDAAGVVVIRNNTFGGAASVVTNSTGYTGKDTRVPDGNGSDYSIKIGGSRSGMLIENNQDEAVEYSFVNNASTYGGPFTFIGNTFQGWVLLSQSCTVHSAGNNWHAGQFRDGASASARIFSHGDHVKNTKTHLYDGTAANNVEHSAVVKTTASSNTIGVPDATAALAAVGERVIINLTEPLTRHFVAQIRSIGAAGSHSTGHTNVVLEDRETSADYDMTTTATTSTALIIEIERKMDDFIGGSVVVSDIAQNTYNELRLRKAILVSRDGNAATGESQLFPVFTIVGQDSGGIAKRLLRIGKASSDGNPLHWYDFERSITTGFLDIIGSQSGFSGITFDSRVLSAESDALATGASPVTLDCDGSNHFTWTPDQAATVNASNVNNGQSVYLVITTSGTTSYTITFGTNFKSSGTLATGTTDGAVHIIEFFCSGGNLVEVNRQTGL